jgi:hypothetical protein
VIVRRSWQAISETVVRDNFPQQSKKYAFRGHCDDLWIDGARTNYARPYERFCASTL